jgi:hypothetical protein
MCEKLPAYWRKLLDKPILQSPATLRNRSRRIVALEKVAGSIPAGHPYLCR